MCDVNMEPLIIDTGVLGALRVLKTLRVHQRTQRAVDLDHWHSSLINVVDMCHPTFSDLVAEAIGNSSQSIFNFVFLHYAHHIFIVGCANNQVNIGPMEAKACGVRAIHLNIIIRKHLLNHL